MWPYFLDLDPIDAIMHEYHTKNSLSELTIRFELPLVIQVASNTPEDEAKAIGIKMIPLNSAHGLVGLFSRLPDRIETCNLEIDIGDSAAECLENLANTYGMEELARYIRCLVVHRETPISANHLNIIWRHQVDAHKDCMVKADEMLATLLAHMNSRYELYLEDHWVKEWTNWVNELFRTGKLTSRWNLYKPVREVKMEE